MTHNSLKMPDITPAQIAAIVKFVVVAAGLFGLNISGDVSDALEVALTAIVAAVSAVLILADTIIRGNRAKAKAAGALPETYVSDR